jgi:catechol 2,3-dioxygenase-like lactoylglutathione lyase family enzyme
MLANSTLVAFSATTDATRARAFYEGMLGLQFVSEDDFAIVYDVNGMSLRIQKVAHIQPQPFTVLGWSVASIDTTASQLAAKGVVFERYPSLAQDPRGIWQSPSGAKIAWLKDPDGSIISLTEPAVGPPGLRPKSR